MTLRVAIAPGRPLPLALAFALGLVLVLDVASGGVREARAQVSPSPLPPTGSEATPQPKKQGVAEKAETSAETLPTTPVLPPIQNERKRFELFELNGYFRLRTNWFKNFHLGYNDNPLVGGAPFPRPLSCPDDAGCGEDTLQSVDMRLRLEPTINIGETAQVYLQLDALDNVVLGSTPVTRTGAGATTGVPSGFDDNQAPPEAGFNSYADSIRVKRAWAEVETSLGQLTFGRQPWHWGLGIYANSGGHDPFSDTYDLHDDFGDTVDRVMFRARVPGTRIDAAIAMDWAATGPTASQSGLYLDANPQAGRIGGRPLDLDDADDVSQWTFMLTRFDAPELFREGVERGALAFNYGAFVVYRTQDNELVPGTGADEGTLQLVRRGLTTYTPDAWFRLGRDKLTVEGEAVFTIGSVDNVSDLEPGRSGPENADVEILRFGGVLRSHYSALEGSMRLALEGGVASGDVADTSPAGSLHVSNLRILDPVNGTRLGTFLFDYDYDIDLILFREIIGAVTNAFYVRPSVTYEVSDDIDATINAVISGALRPDGTPGDSRMYGVELDGTVGYRTGGFFLGLAAGVLFPFSALEHKGTAFDSLDPDGIGPLAPVPDNHEGDGNAYTIQSRMALEF